MMRPGRSWMAMSRSVTFVAAAVSLPILLVCALVTRNWVETERGRHVAQTAELSVRATGEVERFLAARVVMLQALATSPALDDRNFERFAEQARQLLDLEGVSIILRDCTGQEHVDSRLEPGAALPAVTFETDAAVLATQGPQISDLSYGCHSRLPCMRVSVPVLREGEVRYFLDAAMHPVVFGDLLRRAGVHEPYMGGVVDSHGIVIARLPSSGTAVGKAQPSFAERTGDRGVWTGRNLSGTQIRTEYRRLQQAGWLVSVGVGQDVLDAPLWKALGLLACLGLALVTASALAALPIVRRLRSAQGAAAAASAISAENEARYRALADGLPQMVWVMDARDGRATYANAQFHAYYGDIGADRAERAGRHHPDDAERMMAAWGVARDGQAGYEIEGRLRRHDGVHRWHKLVLKPVHLDGAVTEWIGTALDIDDLVAARRDLEETTDLLRLAQDAAGAGVWEWELDAATVRLSPASARLMGLAVEADAAVVLSPDAWKDLIWPEDRPALSANARRAMAAGTAYSAEFRVRRPGETAPPRWLQTFGRVVPDERTGRAVRVVGLHIDITARREAEEAVRASEARLRVSEERLGLALDSGEDGLFDWDLASGAVWASERWRAKLGITGDPAQPSAHLWIAAIHPGDRESVAEATRAHLKGLTPSLDCEYRLSRVDGETAWVLARARVASRSPDGRAARLVGTLIDISRRKAAEARVEHMALHDALTGLPNRNLFRQRLDLALRRAAAAPDRHAVLSLDLDRFKAVNDTFGHPAGDRLLCLVAERIGASVRDRDTVARLGGDEFAVILTDIDGEAAAAGVCERIIAAVDEPLLLDGAAIDIGVSVGAALLPSDGTGAEAIFQRADMALFQAKAAGRNTYRMFEAEAHARTAVRSLLALDMKEAIRRGDFVLVYQPIIDVTRDTVVSFEALMRWRHPERGLISPAEFIPVAEETGLIVPLGTWALKQACREALNWPASVRVSVNVSAVQFRGGLEEAVVAALAGSGLPAGRLKLEVTESVLVHNPEQAVAVLHRLRALGVKIALDDFGTGYSSLSYLRSFPFDKLKIDRAFIRDIADPDAAAIVRAVVGIGERLGMGIVAEGVETEEQLDLVRREGCAEVQGFLFSKPLPAADARAFARQPAIRSAA